MGISISEGVEGGIRSRVVCTCVYHASCRDVAVVKRIYLVCSSGNCARRKCICVCATQYHVTPLSRRHAFLSFRFLSPPPLSLCVFFSVSAVCISLDLSLALSSPSLS